MNKIQLKNYLKTLNLEKSIEDLLFELIDKSTEVNQQLLDIIADVLDMQADYYEETADVLESIADLYQDMKDEIELVKLNQENEKLELINKNKDGILKMIEEKIEKLKNTSAAQ